MCSSPPYFLPGARESSAANCTNFTQHCTWRPGLTGCPARASSPADCPEGSCPEKAAAPPRRHRAPSTTRPDRLPCPSEQACCLPGGGPVLRREPRYVPQAALPGCNDLDVLDRQSRTGRHSRRQEPVRQHQVIPEGQEFDTCPLSSTRQPRNPRGSGAFRCHDAVSGAMSDCADAG